MDTIPSGGPVSFAACWLVNGPTIRRCQAMR